MVATMGSIGEKAFLRGLLSKLTADPGLVGGFGHDAGVVDLGIDTLVAINTDRCPTPISWVRGWSTAAVWGRLAVTTACSDLLAIGAAPRALSLWSPRAPGSGPALVGSSRSRQQPGHDVAGPPGASALPSGP